MNKTKIVFCIVIMFQFTFSINYKLVPVKTDETKDLECIAIYDSLWMMGSEQNCLLYSNDGAKSWKSIITDGDDDRKIRTLHMTKSGVLLVAGGYWSANHIKTIDRTLTKVSEVWENDKIEIYSFLELDNGRILGIGDDDSYILSDNSYLNWEEIKRPWIKNRDFKDYREININKVIQMNNGEILLGGSNGFIACLSSDLLNLNFIKIFFSGEKDFNDLVQVPNGNIFSVSDDGEIFVSSDNARSWSVAPCENSCEKSLCAIAFDEKGNGVAVGDSSIIATDDWGKSWQFTSKFADNTYNDVISNENDQFFIIGDDGIQYRFLFVNE